MKKAKNTFKCFFFFFKKQNKIKKQKQETKQRKKSKESVLKIFSLEGDLEVTDYAAILQAVSSNVNEMFK